MKKIVNLVLACILMLFVNTFALASEMNPEQQPGKVFVAEHSGIEIDIPGEYEKIKGAIEFTDLGIILPGARELSRFTVCTIRCRRKNS